jgi:predicted Zn-dependent peptidase
MQRILGWGTTFVFDMSFRITVVVKAGSRQENINNSSVANFAAHGALNGTQKYSKDKIDELVDSFGGQLEVKVER